MNHHRKKLCIVVPGHWSQLMGGSQYQVKCLIDILVSKGVYEIFYITRLPNHSYHPQGYKIISIGKGRSSRRSLFRLVFDAVEISRILKDIRPDIIYQRVGCGHTGIAAHYSYKNTCKMLWHIAHEMEVSKQKIRLSAEMLYSYFDKKLLEYGISKSDHIIAQTLDQSRLLEKNYNRVADMVVPNFHPYPTERIEKNMPIKIVWIANLKPWKQPEYFIRLAYDLQGIVPDVKFIMVGAMQGTSGWQAKIKDSMRDARQLEYIGEQPQEEVNKILATAHIFVNTSRWEGFANTFIQAWMRKVPVVSLEINPDRLFDANNVGLFSGTYEKMREDVLTLVRNPDMRIKMGEDAQRYAFENHSERNVQKMIQLFDAPLYE